MTITITGFRWYVVRINIYLLSFACVFLIEPCISQAVRCPITQLVFLGVCHAAILRFVTHFLIYWSFMNPQIKKHSRFIPLESGFEHYGFFMIFPRAPKQCKLSYCSTNNKNPIADNNFFKVCNSKIKPERKLL